MAPSYFNRSSWVTGGMGGTIFIVYIDIGRCVMAAKRTILYFTIDPEVRNRYKAAAALSGKSLREWALEAMEEKMEEDLAAGHGLTEALRLAEALHPRIKAGTKGKVDAAENLGTLRKERLKAVGS